MQMMMAFDLAEEQVGCTLWWNPEDALDPAGDQRVEETITLVEHIPPSSEFTGGGVIVSDSLRIIPGASMVGISEEQS